MEQLEKVVISYKEKMDSLENKKAIYKEAKERFEKQWESFNQDLKKDQEIADQEKLVLVSIAEAEYKISGNKKLFGGIGIREKNILSYDLAKAESFAKDKNMFMMFDQKSFEKAAPSLNLDFVSNGKEIQVTIPKEIKI